jgi:hypothetical protein
MNNEETPGDTPQASPPQTPPTTPTEPPTDLPQDLTDSDTETENTNPDTQSDTSTAVSDCCNDYPCPPQPEPEKCDSYYVPINMQLCPVVKLYVNKPKVCLINKAECIPCFLDQI